MEENKSSGSGSGSARVGQGARRGAAALSQGDGTPWPMAGSGAGQPCGAGWAAAGIQHEASLRLPPRLTVVHGTARDGGVGAILSIPAERQASGQVQVGAQQAGRADRQGRSRKPWQAGMTGFSGLGLQTSAHLITESHV